MTLVNYQFRINPSSLSSLSNLYLNIPKSWDKLTYRLNITYTSLVSFIYIQVRRNVTVTTLWHKIILVHSPSNNRDVYSVSKGIFYRWCHIISKWQVTVCRMSYLLVGTFIYWKIVSLLFATGIHLLFYLSLTNRVY